LVLLGLAGLLRPEAWLFIAGYWLWLFPSRDWPARIRLALLAVAAPAVWLVSDALVTGDALWSLHGTHDLAGQLKRPTGIENVPRLMPRRLGEIVRLPELIASVIGFAGALLWLRRRARAQRDRVRDPRPGWALAPRALSLPRGRHAVAVRGGGRARLDGRRAGPSAEVVAGRRSRGDRGDHCLLTAAGRPPQCPSHR